MHNKPEIVFTLPACMGGVASFNYNIVNHSRLIKNFHSKVILLRAVEDSRAMFLDKFNADEVIIFNYSHKENQYYVQKRLSELLGNESGAIVTDNSLTIVAAKVFKNPKTVFHLVHDYFYVTQNIQLGDLVDVSIAHSSFFSDAVFASDPNLFFNRSFYIPYGVQQLPKQPIKDNAILNLVFLGRLDEGKGVMLLKKIEDQLKEKNLNVHWTIIGKGPLKESLVEQWKHNQNISFEQPDTTDEVYTILNMQDIFIFSTSFEGTPVSILECLANGVVTITNDLPGGIRDIVKEGIGYRCELNNLSEFTEKIITLNNNRTLLKQMQQNCFQLSANHYNIENNADNYFRIFMQYETFKRKTKNKSIKMSRLDNLIFPNEFVKFFRSIK